MKLKTWNSHNINDLSNYKATVTPTAYSLAGYDPVTVERSGKFPKLGAVRRPERQIGIDIFILKEASRDTLAEQLLTWFDPDDETSKKLVIEDDASGNDRYVYAICQALDCAGTIRRLKYHATLVIDGDPMWREEASATAEWAITASGQTTTLTNNGNAEAYPILQVKPTGVKSSGYAYQRWIPIRWRAAEGHALYPVDILDNNLDAATLIGAGKMQADGDDLRVRVDGLEVNRWLQDINTATAQCWISVPFQAKQEVLISVACASAGAIDTITAASDISGFPAAGTLVIDAEAFVYTGRDDSAYQFTGVTRSAKGTAAAEHTVGDTAWWVQHDIWVLYGDASLTTPAATTVNKPMFSLASTNTSWVYADFGEGGVTRAASWTPVMNGAEHYTANRYTQATTWAELGIACLGRDSKYGDLFVMNPCYITNINLTNGEYWCDTAAATYWNPRVGEYHPGTYLGWNVDYGLGFVPSYGAWTAWSLSQALGAGTTGVRLGLTSYQPDPWVSINTYLEAADVTLTLNSSYTPAITIGDEQAIYNLDCKIKNNTTGDEIGLLFAMVVDQELEVNTDAKTVTYLADGSSQYQALTLVGGLRKDWLPLAVGANEILYTETNATAMTIEWEWEERHYQ